MSCIGWDGKPTRPGLSMLRAVSRGAASPEEVAKVAGASLFLTRSGLREMAQGGFLAFAASRYELTQKGQEAIDAPA